jgi:hypothetical protein
MNKTLLITIITCISTQVQGQCPPSHKDIFDFNTGDKLVYRQTYIPDTANGYEHVGNIVYTVVDFLVDSTAIQIELGKKYRNDFISFKAPFDGFTDCGGGAIDVFSEMFWFRPDKGPYNLYAYLAKDSIRKYRVFTAKNPVTGAKDSFGYYHLDSIKNNTELEIVYGEKLGMYRKTMRYGSGSITQQLIKLIRGTDTIQVYNGLKKPLGQKELFLFPNPALNEVYVSHSELVPVQYEMYTIMGEVKLKGVLTNGASRITLDRLPGGVYWVKVVIEDAMYVQKLVKK